MRVLFSSMCLALGDKNSVVQKRDFRRGLESEVGLESQAEFKIQKGKASMQKRTTLRAHASTRLIDF